MSIEPISNGGEEPTHVKIEGTVMSRDHFAKLHGYDPIDGDPEAGAEFVEPDRSIEWQDPFSGERVFPDGEAHGYANPVDVDVLFGAIDEAKAPADAEGAPSDPGVPEDDEPEVGA